MKKSLLVIVAVATLFAFSPNRAMAQKEQGESVVTLGVASSLSGLLFKAIQNSVNAVSGAGLEIKTTPGMQLMYDFGISDRFSLGVAGSYQGFSMNYSNYLYDTLTIGQTFKDKVTRMNFGLRPLVHLGNSDNVDTYLGARFGYTRWAYTSTNTDPNWIDEGYTGFGNRMRIQALFGLRYFFTDNIGINGELGIGAPYFMMGGLNIKF